jgi:hypothetical protein
MAEKLVRDETPLEFFREQLVRAMEHQRVSTSAFTEYYLVNLLTACVQGDPLPAEPGNNYDETPLALVYLRSLTASRAERTRLLRATGDSALFVSGFFADSLMRKMADLAYYRAMGGQAYRRLSQEDARGPVGGGVFSELARRFTEFADVLSEVSEATRPLCNRSVLTLYERWLQTRSRWAAELLAEQGLTPMAPSDEGPLQ